MHSGFIIAQSTNLDSLENLYQKGISNDSIRINVLSDICFNYVTTDYSKMTPYLDTLNSLEEKIYGKDKFFKVQILMGYFNKAIGNFDKAFIHFENAMKIYEENNDTLNMIRSLYRLGELKNNTHNAFQKAQTNVSYYLKALNLLKYYKNNEQEILLLNGYASALLNEGKLDSAFQFLLKSRVLYDSTDFPRKKRSFGFFNYHMGRYFYDKSDLPTANQYLTKSYNIAKELNAEDLLIEDNYYLGELYRKLGFFEKAEQYFLDNLELQGKRGVQWKRKAYMDLMDFYSLTNNLTKLSQFYKISRPILDSTMLDIAEQSFAEYETKYKLNETLLENKILNNKNEFQSQNLILTLIIAALLFIIISLIILYLWYKISAYSKKLALSNNYKDKILSILGHDMRSPLLAQVHALQRLTSEIVCIDEKRIHELYLSTLSVYKISDNVYNWIKNSKGILVKNQTCQIIHEILLVLEQYESIISCRKIKVSKNFSYDADILIKGDRLGVQAIIRNIIDNATKYNKEGGEISISLQHINQELQLTIFNTTENAEIQKDNFLGKSGIGYSLISDILFHIGGHINFFGNVENGFETIVDFKKL
ncbi:MAG: hypothetical protein H6567_04115 [Lewinellaceae bacterium]|nr:hypothetical protein [Lewinellaceae bacterium]